MSDLKETDFFADEDAFDDGDTFVSFSADDDLDEGASAFDSDAFDDFDSPEVFTSEEIELVAEPVQNTEEIAKEAVFAALNDVFSARGGTKGAHAASAAVKDAAPASEGVAETAKPMGRHATLTEDISYEEPEAPQADLAVKGSSAGGRHAVGGAHAVAEEPKESIIDKWRAKIQAKKDERASLTPGQLAVRRVRRQAKIRKASKICAVSLAAAVLAGAIGVYAYGVVYFGSHVMPNTTVDGVDVSNLDTEQAKAALDSHVEDYKCSVSGNDFYLLLRGSDIDFSADTSSLVDRIISEGEKWTWPLHMKDTRSYDFSDLCTWNDTKLASLVNGYVEPHNDGVTPSQDAYAAFSDEADRFIAVSEIIGNGYHASSVIQSIHTALSHMGPHVALADDSLIMPEVYANSPDLVEDVDAMNGFLGADFDIIVDITDTWSDYGRVLDHIGSAQLAQWIHLDDNGEAYFDADAMYAWAEEYATSHFTYRTWRTYVRPDGEEISIAYGTYGWNYNVDEFYNRLVSAIMYDKVGVVELPCYQSAHVWIDDEHPIDWGDTYIDITISTQIVRYYVDGEEVLIAPTVSGDINSGQGTPLGCYYITRKLSPTHLRGENTDGSSYDVPVDYWMAFIENSHGLHDNPNRSVFGWPWAFRDAGSHGCCNLPYDKAEKLYSMVEIGTPVIIHW